MFNFVVYLSLKSMVGRITYTEPEEPPLLKKVLKLSFFMLKPLLLLLLLPEKEFPVK